MNSWIPMLFIYHLFDAHIVLDLAIDTLSGWLLWPFFMSPSFFDHLLFFLHSKIFHAHLVLSLPWPKNQTAFPGFPGSFWFKYCRSHFLATKIWFLGVLSYSQSLSVV